MSNTSTDPAGFDSEATGAFRVGSLADSVQERELALRAPIENGPALVYIHSDSTTRTYVDRTAPAAPYGDDDRLRELAVARALLVHALRLVDRELNR